MRGAEGRGSPRDGNRVTAADVRRHGVAAAVASEVGKVMIHIVFTSFIPVTNYVSEHKMSQLALLCNAIAILK